MNEMKIQKKEHKKEIKVVENYSADSEYHQYKERSTLLHSNAEGETIK